MVKSIWYNAMSLHCSSLVHYPGPVNFYKIILIHELVLNTPGQFHLKSWLVSNSNQNNERGWYAIKSNVAGPFGGKIESITQKDHSKGSLKICWIGRKHIQLLKEYAESRTWWMNGEWVWMGMNGDQISPIHPNGDEWGWIISSPYPFIPIHPHASPCGWMGEIWSPLITIPINPLCPDIYKMLPRV